MISSIFVRTVHTKIKAAVYYKIDNNTINKQSDRIRLFSFPYDSTDKNLSSKLFSSRKIIKRSGLDQ